MGFHIPSMAEIQQVALSRGRDSLAPGLWPMAGDWPLQERGGDLCFDVSGNRKTGTMTAMDPPTDRVLTEMGRALDFDGTDDYVQMPGAHFGSTITLSFWWIPPDLVADGLNRRICGQFGTPGFTWVLYYLHGNKLSLWDGSDTTCVAPAANTLVHVCVTNSPSACQIYYNAVPQVMTGGGQSWAAGADDFMIGKTDPELKGPFTNLAIFPRVITLDEIQDLYARPWARHTLRTKVLPAAVAPVTGFARPKAYGSLAAGRTGLVA